MIESIKLWDFQLHGLKFVEFGPTVTTLVGKTGAGKSAIIRALLVACRNTKIKDDKIVRHGATKTKIILKVDGHTIVRIKGKGVNTYKLDGKVFKAFGPGGVPRDIEQLLNVTHVNFQRQLDLPFWFTDTAGTVSKNLNQIVNLGEIDDALANVASDLRHAKLYSDVVTSRLQFARAEVQSLSWVPEFIQDFGRLEQLETDWHKTARECVRLRDLSRGVRNLTLAQRFRSEAILEGRKATVAGKVWSKTRVRLDDLRQLTTQIRDAQKFASVVVPDIKPLITMRKVADAVADRRRMLEQLIEEIKTKEIECQRTKKLLSEKSSVLKNVKGMKCPTCQQPIKSSHCLPVISTSPMTHQPQGQRKGKSGTNSKPVIFQDSGS